MNKFYSLKLKIYVTLKKKQLSKVIFLKKTVGARFFIPSSPHCLPVCIPSLSFSVIFAFSEVIHFCLLIYTFSWKK